MSDAYKPSEHAKLLRSELEKAQVDVLPVIVASAHRLARIDGPDLSVPLNASAGIIADVLVHAGNALRHLEEMAAAGFGDDTISGPLREALAAAGAGRHG